MERTGLSIRFLTLVEDQIRLVEERMRERVPDHHPDLHAVLAHLISSGGKRVRPAVALLTGIMLGADQQRLVTLAASIEMLHTATLVHDDLIDGALLRRGIPTVNATWSPAATVLTGDYIFARAAELAAQTDSVPVMRTFAETLAVIVNGEITQLFTSRGLSSRENYFQRIYAKTASMFVLAAKSAALISPVDDGVVETMRDYGYQIGMAFQIVDDILDFVGDQASVGKPVASDLRQGLVTLPAICYHEANPDDPDMQAVLQGQYHNEERMSRLIEAIRQSDAIQQAQQEAREFVLRAQQCLTHLPDTIERQALHELGDYIIARTT
ncbi:MAG: polyprenyl synthetase family protein [Anaerolineae bacterium]|nr:MAG: polyprenyl synthetase family protein [Anaerolineae bacterium]